MNESSIEEKALFRYQRENMEQLDTIQRICQVLEIPNLYEIISQQKYALTSSQQIKIKTDKNNDHEDNLRKIKELEEELERKQTSYKQLEQQIQDYISNAKQFEELLEKNEKEKAELLMKFQQSSNSNVNGSMTIEDLEDKVIVMKDERDRLKREANSAIERCEKLKEQLQASHNQAKTLQQQLIETRSKLNTDSPLAQYKSNEITIENLQRQIERAKQKIQSLKDDNAMLIKALNDSTDLETNEDDGDTNTETYGTNTED